ncbi:MAG: translational GTPase TypA, partial [Patescibacteria group bacterium]|nr:translational GTPase TypA [Patescibacteria group bacterium]
SAEAGDIVMVAGLPDIYIGETICENAEQAALPAIAVDEPTISLNFLVNNSPFAGREGRYVTSRQIRERLERELEVNIGLRVDFSATDYYKVYGRGELHIAILLETMRREGYELQVSQPHVIIKAVEGKEHEPFEEVTIDVPTDMSGVVIEHMGKRRGVMRDLKTHGSHTRLVFEMPTRGLLGFRNQFLVDTRGEGILASRVIGFKPYAGEIEKRDFGSMVSMAPGKVLAYALDNLQDRGTLYVTPGTEAYEGMVIGSVNKGTDLTVNPVKGKHLTNVRSAGEEGIQLKAAFPLTLERGLEIVADDEYLEITPKSVRMRKQLLSDIDRVRDKRQKTKISV